MFDSVWIKCANYMYFCSLHTILFKDVRKCCVLLRLGSMDCISACWKKSLESPGQGDSTEYVCGHIICVYH